ncbi:hypothetical protein [Pseudomonas chlororaphis]|uniref:hypothetical protein n=1 Tax=Pseudomonas chlororaphis TaxID=587753 RepID=UPI00048C3F2D|nr:hypothetical protein [Pseudomonas chlororaphis]
MTTSNIKQFDEHTGLVLGALYESFPVPRPLLIEDFAPDGFSSDDFLGTEVLNEKGEFLFACIDWLAESGYLRFKKRVHNTGFTDAVLTAKGLEVLKAIPDSVSTGPSLGEQLVNAAKSGVKGAVGSAAGKVFSLGVKIASSHLGLPG